MTKQKNNYCQKQKGTRLKYTNKSSKTLKVSEELSLIRESAVRPRNSGKTENLD